MNKPDGKHRCLACGREWDGQQLNLDPATIAVRWTCGDAFCGGTVTPVRAMQQVGEFKLLPPPPGFCEVCAVQHEPGEPHNQQSFYYQFVFYNQHGRSPTWADAMAHCTDEVKALWAAELANFGVTVEISDTEEAS